MTIVTVRPSSDVDIAALTLSTGSTAYTLLSDDTASNVSSMGPAHLVEGWPAPTSPSAGSVVKEVRFKVAYIGVGSLRFISIAIGGGATLTYGNAAMGAFSTTVQQIASWPISAAGTAQTQSNLYPDIFASATITIYEAWLDYVYVQKPFVQVSGPADGSTITTNRPTVVAAAYFDKDGDNGGMPDVWHTKVYVDSGSPNPDTTPSPALDSGDLPTSGPFSAGFTGVQEYRDDETVLANDNYVAFARFGYKVNGTRYWSDWEQSNFTVDAPAPGVPDITLTPEEDQGRMRIDVQGHQGDAQNVFVQIQYSFDGGVNWADLRTTLDFGYVLAVGSATDLTSAGDPPNVTAFDYEGGNGQPVSYRARGIYLNFFVPGSDITFSAWSGKSTDSWEDPLTIWLKNPVNPAQNIRALLQSYVGKSAAARQGVFQPLGANLPIVVADTRGGATGSVTILCLSDLDRDVLDEIVGANMPLLLQPGSDDHEPDRYMVLGDQTRARVQDKAYVVESTDEFAWTEVNRPEGNLAWDTTHNIESILELQPEWAADFTDTDPGLPANTLNDNFTAADGTVLSSHTADSGDTWTQHTTAGTTATITSNRIRVTAGGVVARYYSSDVPASADYVVEAKIRCVTNVGGAVAGVNARLNTGADTMYQAIALAFGGSQVWWGLFKRVAGTSTQLGSWYTGDAFSAGQDRTVQIKVQEDYVDLVLNGVTRIEAQDTAITAAGRAAVELTNGSSTTGFHMDYVQARPIKTATVLDRTAGGRDLTMIGEFSSGDTPSLPSVGGSMLLHQSPEKGGWGSLAAWSYQPFGANAKRTFAGTAIHTGLGGVPCYFGSLVTGATQVETVLEGVDDGNGYIQRVHYNSNVNVMGVFGSAIWHCDLPYKEWFHWALTVEDNVPTGYQTIHLFINGVSMDGVTNTSTGLPNATNPGTRQVKWDANVGTYLVGMRGQGNGQVAIGHAIEGSLGPQAVYTRILTDDEIKGLAQAAGLY